MTFTLPAALLGLVLVPLVWWWHRRRHRPRVVEVPALLFVRDEPRHAAARRATVDYELWLAVAATTLAVLAAAGPRLVEAPAGRTVRVVRSGGAPATATGWSEAVSEVLDELRAALGPSDVLDVVQVPEAHPHVRRPSVDALLSAARAGRAGWRMVLSDRPAPPGATGVTWLAVGLPEPTNVGVVAAALEPIDGGVQVFVTLAGTADGPTDVVLRLDAGNDGPPLLTQVALPPGGLVSHTFSLPSVGATVRLALQSNGARRWEDSLAADDRVTWERRRLTVSWGAGPPADGLLRRALRVPLDALLGASGWTLVEGSADLVVRTEGGGGGAGSAVELRLHPVPPGGAGERAPRGSDAFLADPLVADLSTSGADLVYAPGARAVGEGATWLLWREGRGGRWPVVVRRGTVLHFLPDPLAGHPAPVEGTLWPLWIDNVVRAALGDERGDGSWGYRRRGLLDLDSTRLGTGGGTLDVSRLATLPPDRPARILDLVPWLALLTLVAVFALWAAPRLPSRSRSASRRASRS